jgi:hypothetical protein
VKNRPIVNRSSSVGGKSALQDAFSLSVSPNPTGNILNISAKGIQDSKKMTISIVSASGVVLKTIQSNGLSRLVQLDVSSLVAGIYSVKVTCGDKVIYRQFVKI